jgi:organic hydroperoxide reductase OsmC/OhrA
MSEHRAKIDWRRSGEFRYESYSRSHVMAFGDIRVPGNAAPENIPATVPGAIGVDPEQSFVAALSACHMLWFLHLACKAGLIVDRYVDEASGTLDKTWISEVRLRPAVTFSGKAPTEKEHTALHERAHEKCFIANSVKTNVRIEPRIA